MKPIFAVIGGFALSFGMFIAGIVFAVFVMIGEPPQTASANGDIADVWTSEPRAVNTAAQAKAFERLPPVQQSGAGMATAAVVPEDAADPIGGEAVQPAVDTMTTAALPLPDGAQAEMPEAEDPTVARLQTAHAEWCARRYRSYDAGTNSYRPYAGGRRECMSPYWAEYAALSGEPTPADSHERFVPLADDFGVEETVVVYESPRIELPSTELSSRRLSIRPATRTVSTGGFNFDRSGQ